MQSVYSTAPTDWARFGLVLWHMKHCWLLNTKSCLYIRGVFNNFPDFFCTGILNCCRFLLLLYILWDDWPIFMISGSNEKLQQQLEYTQLQPNCHSWWISKMHCGREETLEERYAIKFCFKLGKIPQKRMECFRLVFDRLAWIEHQFLSGIRD